MLQMLERMVLRNKSSLSKSSVMSVNQLIYLGAISVETYIYYANDACSYLM